MQQQRKIKVWNKTVIIENVPDYITDAELIEWTKKKLLVDGIYNMGKIAS